MRLHRWEQEPALCDRGHVWVCQGCGLRSKGNGRMPPFPTDRLWFNARRRAPFADCDLEIVTAVLDD